MNWLAKNKEYIIFFGLMVVAVVVAIHVNNKYVEPRVNNAKRTDTIAP